MAGNQPNIEADLVIIGAGYAGINALNAAAKYVPKGGKIAWVDKRNTFGGMWVDQYDFVTLHQPHELFTAGERRWKKKFHWSHLSTKTEILEHFADIVKDCCEERDITLIQLFGHELVHYEALESDNIVEVHVAPVDAAKGAQSTTVRAPRMIKATGFKVPIKQPLEFSASEHVVSLAPVNVLTEENKREIESSLAPIYVIGSGKTAIDVMKNVAKLDIGNRLHCISGNGTNFVNRDKVFPRKGLLAKYSPFNTDSFPDVILRMAEMHDGTNSKEVIQKLRESGHLHSPIDGATNFVMGICSEEEVSIVKQALSPAKDKIFRAHLVDIVEEDSKVYLEMRSLDKKTKFKEEIPSGSFVVNCTDHFTSANLEHEPVISANGMVLAPQTLAGFTGPSANVATHLWYRNKLDSIWEELPRLEADLNDKAKFGIELGTVVLVAGGYLENKVGRQYTTQFSGYSTTKMIGLGGRIISNIKNAYIHMVKTISTRFTDPVQEIETLDILAGNIGKKAQP